MNLSRDFGIDDYCYLHLQRSPNAVNHQFAAPLQVETGDKKEGFDYSANFLTLGRRRNPLSKIL
jgi:hypothetical protein